MRKIHEIYELANDMLAPETRKMGNLEERLAATIGLVRDTASYIGALSRGCGKIDARTRQLEGLLSDAAQGAEPAAPPPAAEPAAAAESAPSASPEEGTEDAAAWVMAGIPKDDEPAASPQPPPQARTQPPKKQPRANGQ